MNMKLNMRKNEKNLTDDIKKIMKHNDPCNFSVSSEMYFKKLLPIMKKLNLEYAVWFFRGRANVEAGTVRTRSMDDQACINWDLPGLIE